MYFRQKTELCRNCKICNSFRNNREKLLNLRQTRYNKIDFGFFVVKKINGPRDLKLGSVSSRCFIDVIKFRIYLKSVLIFKHLENF